MIFIALGANLPSRFGEPSETIAAALETLAARELKIVKASKIWLTAPVPVSDQPWYHNAVISVETNLDAFELLSLLHKIEANFGRVRYERNAPRILDLDLIAYHDDIIDRPSLIVPHPRMQDRAFVLLPLQEIAPDWAHPVSKKSLSAMLALTPSGQTAKRA